MAEVYTEGYRIGFINTGKDLSKKSVVSIRYVLGFERVIKLAIANFAKMGLKPVIYRAGVSVLTKARNGRAGYYGGIPVSYTHLDVYKRQVLRWYRYSTRDQKEETQVFITHSWAQQAT